jgi:hypothetical protein
MAPLERTGWAAFKDRCFGGLAFQLLWTFLYVGFVPGCYPCGDMMGHALLAATALFWLFVLYIGLRRGAKATRADLRLMICGLPIFSLVTLAAWFGSYRIQAGHWP